MSNTSSAPELISNKDSRDARLMMSRQMITLPFRFGRSLIIIPLLTPEIMFVVRLIATWFSYLPRVTIGTLSVLNFFYPEAEAKGDEVSCRRYRQLAWRFTLAGSLAGILVGSFISFRFLEGALLLPLVLWGLITVPNEYARNHFRATGGFSAIARIDIINTLLAFGLSLAGVIFYGLSGYVWGLFLATASVFVLGFSTYFPPPEKLPLEFVRHAVSNGLHLWANGFLRQLCNGWELTLFAFSGKVPQGMAGQYAVALTLTNVMTQVLNSINSVFQRKVTKNLAASDPKDRNHDMVFDFATFNLLIFLVTTVPIIAGTQVLLYFLPKYARVIDFLPQLLLGAFMVRLRYYPGVVFRVERRMIHTTVSDLLHLVPAVAGFMVIVQWELPLVSIAWLQVVAAVTGTIYCWALMARRLPNLRRLGQFALLILAFAGWIVGCSLSLGNLTYHAIVLFGGAAILYPLTRYLFPGGHLLLLQTALGRFLKHKSKQ
ncbi:MAG: hypothetical protein QNK37_02325 [Acidobacteriota bacterium]|nr:hypothetical protein [Acidobacteriota bacterium]